MVVTTLPTSTTNITGFLTCTRGSNFLNEAGMALRMILESQIEMPPLRRVFHCFTSKVSVWIPGISVFISECPPRVHQKLFDNGSQRVGREKGQRANDQDHADQEANEERFGRGEGSQPGGDNPLLRQCSAQSQQGNDLGKAANEHGKAQ